MKKGWKIIEIDMDDDEEIITAWVDGEITREFNKDDKSKK